MVGRRYWIHNRMRYDMGHTIECKNGEGVQMAKLGFLPNTMHAQEGSYVHRILTLVCRLEPTCA